MARAFSSSTPVPSTVLDLVLEEIHIRRKIILREWQLSSVKREERVTTGCKISDEGGNDLESFSLVHPSWTPVARHVSGRILVLSDVSERAAKNGAATPSPVPTFGSWTREVYLSFSRDYTEPLAIWESIFKILDRTLNILTLCLQTTAREGDRRIPSMPAWKGSPTTYTNSVNFAPYVSIPMSAMASRTVKTTMIYKTLVSTPLFFTLWRRHPVSNASFFVVSSHVTSSLGMSDW
ncbi:hypothetical protein SCHPADRAFT_220669 [Schizopora paradoxa]|uniref:Uncharacterized protein n=1 Tax=Schizopora paradoxa TaxID=27342 RepID=A0A0H2RWM8_9AGAM|nr:hypothetical protein SCHPADRAFT_220669 [Schizopora paradoxa]